jgi:hypothetical protein
MLMKCEKDTGEKMDIPISDRQILIFINWLARSRGLKAATISTYLSGIRQLHIVKGIEPPVIRTGLVKLVLKGISNRDGVTRRAEYLTGRLPMTTNVMMLFKKLVSKADMHTTDKALIWATATVAFAGAFRIHELLCKTESFFDPDFDLLEKDVSFSTDKTGKTTVHVKLKSPKESRDNKHTTVDIFQNDGPLCPIAALNTWRRMRKTQPNMPFFRLANGTPLTGAKMNQYMGKLLGPYTDTDIGKFTTHSFRIGLATELARLGCSDEEIKQAGRWSSRVFERYVRLKRTKRAGVAKEIKKLTAGRKSQN